MSLEQSWAVTANKLCLLMRPGLGDTTLCCFSSVQRQTPNIIFLTLRMLIGF